MNSNKMTEMPLLKGLLYLDLVTFEYQGIKYSTLDLIAKDDELLNLPCTQYQDILILGKEMIF